MFPICRWWWNSSNRCQRNDSKPKRNFRMHTQEWIQSQKCEFGKGSFTFLGSKITSIAMAPITEKRDKLLLSIKPPRTLKQERRFIGFCQFYKAYIPRLAEKLLPFYPLIKSDTEFVTKYDHISTIEQMKKELKTICENSLRLPKKRLQYVIPAYASFYAAGYVLMVKDYTIT